MQARAIIHCVVEYSDRQSCRNPWVEGDATVSDRTMRCGMIKNRYGDWHWTSHASTNKPSFDAWAKDQTQMFVGIWKIHRSINAARMRQLVTIGTSALLAIHVVYPAFLSPLSQVKVWLVLVQSSGIDREISHFPLDPAFRARFPDCCQTVTSEPKRLPFSLHKFPAWTAFPIRAREAEASHAAVVAKVPVVLTSEGPVVAKDAGFFKGQRREDDEIVRRIFQP
jgi:hypothetical protein